MIRLVAPPGLGATLVGSDGSLHVGGWARRSFRTLGDAPDGLITTLWQEWTIPSDVEPAALRIAVGEGRWLLPIASEAPDRSAATGLTAMGLTVEQVVRIVVRVDEESGTVRACLRSPDRVECGADGGMLAYPSIGGRWRASAPIRWTAALPVEATPLLEHVARPALTCAYRDPDELYAWQFNSLAGSGDGRACRGPSVPRQWPPGSRDCSVGRRVAGRCLASGDSCRFRRTQ